jgi:UbiD family decarboxylase
MAIAVDDDIDVFDPVKVWWSVLTRFQPFAEVVRVPGVEDVPDWTDLLHRYQP